MASVSAYTRFVQFIKRFLWVLVAGMIGVVIWIASDNSSDGRPRLVFSSETKSENVESVMAKPHYQGLNSKNQPYTVIADQAKQLDADTVELSKVSADMLRSAGDKQTWLAMTAKEGILNTKSQEMQLSGGVNVFYEGGYEFRSEKAHIDVQKGIATGNTRVEGQGPMGTLTANGFDISEGGSVIRFNGSVRMKLYR